MRREWRWMLAAILALAVGALGAQLYAKTAAPYYTSVARLIARGHLWQVVEIKVVPDNVGPGSVLQLSGLVRAQANNVQPDAAITARLQVAAVAASPVIFWTMLLVWPTGSYRQRIGFLVLGVPIFLGLEAATTACQLLSPLASASAILAGDDNPLTPWDRWSRFLESGGRIALAIGAVILTISLVGNVRRSAVARLRAKDSAS